MTTARSIIDDALTFRLNRLSIGETADSATDSVCLRALNSIVDELNGSDSLLWREPIIASGSAISAATAQLGATWSGTAIGDQPLGLSWSTTSGGDQSPMWPLTMEQYQAITDKTETGDPYQWAYDGTTFYFWPVPTSHYIHVRVKLSATAFADATTDYAMPAGYKAALTDLLAERLAPIMGGLTPAIVRAAAAARMRLLAQNVNPAIVNTASSLRADITRGW